jgi:hypothetical protein
VTLSEVRETTKQPLEELLNALLVRLITTADEWRECHERRAEEERRAREERQRRWKEEEKEKQWNEWMEAHGTSVSGFGCSPPP